MSLRLRLITIISMLMFAAMVLGVAWQIGHARQRVADEVRSTALLTTELLQTLSPRQLSPSEDAFQEFLASLSELKNIRHLTISLNGTLLTSVDPSLKPPAWFVSLVEPEPQQFHISLGDSPSRQIMIQTRPDDEIAEVWSESMNFIFSLLAVLLLLNSILLVVIERWLRPVQNIVEGIAGVEQGNFNASISPRSLPELKLIEKELSRLSDVLWRSKKENDRLNKKALHIQEQERHYLARELHDELGQNISAIKAIAYSVAARLEASDNESAQGVVQIEAIANLMRDHVRGMMRRLRPAVLDELGLAPALQQMVDEWNRRHSDTFCSLHIQTGTETLHTEQQTHLYRIVQECLTNIARHAEAGRVNIALSFTSGLKLLIEDDGSGFNKEVIQAGMGMRGLNERAQALGALLQISSAPGNGTRITLSMEPE